MNPCEYVWDGILGAISLWMSGGGGLRGSDAICGFGGGRAAGCPLGTGAGIGSPDCCAIEPV